MDGVLETPSSQVSFPIHRTTRSRLPETDLSNPPFGRVFSDHMFVAEFSYGKWHDFRIVPFEKIPFSPAMLALHYGQIIFEGMKAYKTVDGQVVLFRPEKNIERMEQSARRMAMPPFPRELFLEALKTLVALDKDWIPESEEGALYIRPVMFATDEYIGVKPSETYLFIIFTCPVGPYYPEPVRVLIERHYVRAFPGGTGFVKAGGNYGAALMPSRRAQEKGYHQLMWTDGKEHRWIEEIGTMNVFFVYENAGGEIVVATPPLTGTILPGVTRDSILTLARDMGYLTEERPISVEEIFALHQEGRLREVFGTGTAATVTPIIEIGLEEDDGTVHRIAFPEPDNSSVAMKLKQELEGIRRGRIPDRYGWLVPVVRL